MQIELAHAFVAAIRISDLILPKPPTHTLQLEGGKILVLSPSRKSAIPKDLKGGHLVVSIYRFDEYDNQVNHRGPEAVPLAEDELLTEDVAVAYVVATGIARRITHELFSSSGLYRIATNGPGAGTRPYFHTHIIMAFCTKDEFKASGFGWAQLVAPDTHFIGC